MSKALRERFGAVLRREGCAIYAPEEVREAYRKNALYVSAVDFGENVFGESALKGLFMARASLEESLFQFAAAVRASRSSRSDPGGAVSRDRFLPRLIPDDFSSAEWEAVVEAYGLERGFDQLIAFPDGSVAEVFYFQFGFSGTWQRHEHLAVLDCKTAPRNPGMLGDFELTDAALSLGGIIAVKSFFGAEKIAELRKRIGQRIDTVEPISMLEIAAKLKLF